MRANVYLGREYTDMVDWGGQEEKRLKNRLRGEREKEKKQTTGGRES